MDHPFAYNGRSSHFLLPGEIKWSVPSSIQFSLVFANVGGVTGVWPWTKVKITRKYRSPRCQPVSGSLATPAPVRVRCRRGPKTSPDFFRGGWGGREMLAKRGTRPISHDELQPAKLALPEAAGWRVFTGRNRGGVLVTARRACPVRRCVFRS